MDDVGRTDDGQEPVPGSMSMAVLSRASALVALDRIPVPIIAVDENCVIVFANPAFAEMLGRGADGLIGTALGRLLRDPRSVPGTCDDLVRLAGAALTFVHVEGWDVTARMSDSARLDGVDGGCLFAFVDVTERAWETLAWG